MLAALAPVTDGAWAASSRLHEPTPDRVPRQLDAVAHAELLEDVRAVRLDRLLADREDLGDLAVRVALRDELHDLLLARGERVLDERLARAGALGVVADESALGARVEERLAAHRRAARLDEVAVGHGLEDVARGARLEGLEEVALVVVHREDQHAQVGPAGGE